MKESQPKRVKATTGRPLDFRWVARYSAIALVLDSACLEALWYSLDLDYRARRATEAHIEGFVKPELERAGLSDSRHIKPGSPEDPDSGCLKVVLKASVPVASGFVVRFSIEAGAGELRFVLWDRGSPRDWSSRKSGQWKIALVHFLHCFKGSSALVTRLEEAGLRCHSQDLHVTHLCRDLVQVNLSWHASGFFGTACFGTPSRTALSLTILSGPSSTGDWTEIEVVLVAKSEVFDSPDYTGPDWHSGLECPPGLADIFPILDTYTRNLLQAQEAGPDAFIRDALLRNRGAD